MKTTRRLRSTSRNNDFAMFEEIEDCEESSEVLLGWADLPSVVMVEITKNLPSRKDRLNTASVCKAWRSNGFQVPLSDSLHLDMTKGGRAVPSVTFLSQLFICKVSSLKFTFDVSSPTCINTVEQVLSSLLENNKLKSLKLVCSDHCLDYLQRFGRGTSMTEEGQAFVQKVLHPLMKVLQGKTLETFSFPLIQDLSICTGKSLISTLHQSRSRFTLSKLFLPSFKFVEATKTGKQTQSVVGDNNNDDDVAAIPVMSLQGFAKLQMLSLGHEYLSDKLLQTLGRGNTAGGLKRMSLVAVKKNSHVSNSGWSGFVKNNPACRVRISVYGGSRLISHATSLVYPSTPLSHFRSYYSKEMRINFLNSMIGWNLSTLEHLELVDDDSCSWTEILMQMDPEENQILDPIVFAAWRCKALHTIKLGLLYGGDSLVGIARLKGSKLLNLEIPRNRIINNSLTTKKVIKEVSAALGRPWRPLNFDRFPNKLLKTFGNGASCMVLRATAQDEL